MHKKFTVKWFSFTFIFISKQLSTRDVDYPILWYWHYLVNRNKWSPQCCLAAGWSNMHFLATKKYMRSHCVLRHHIISSMGHNYMLWPWLSCLRYGSMFGFKKLAPMHLYQFLDLHWTSLEILKIKKTVFMSDHQ